MTLLKLWVLANMFVLAVSFGARGQEQSSPRERALMERVSIEVNGNLACSTNIATLQDKIKELEAKLKATEKPEAPK